MSPSATDAPRLCPTPVTLCTSAHGKRGKTSREKTYQQSPPGMMSRGNTKPTTVLVRTSCHMESAPPDTKVSSPPVSQGSRSSTSGRPWRHIPATRPFPAVFCSSDCSPRHFGCSPVCEVPCGAKHPSSAAQSSGLLQQHRGATPAVPQLQALNSLWENQNQSRNLLIPQASGLTAGGSS